MIFVVHEHNASRLHWDFRLEMNGVLKSWAVPKEPSVTERRLAIQVEDDDLLYADFEGVINEGNYGAGTVKIWDKGDYDLLEKSDKEIKVFLRGKKLKGKFILLRFPKADNGSKAFLFFKMKE